MLNQLKKWNTELSSQHQIGLIKQIKDILQYRKTCGIGVSEYYELELFDQEKYPDIERCIGRKRSALIDKLLNLDIWRATANDKILNYSLLAHFGFPIPETVATYNAGTARISQEKSLNSPEELHNFFDKEALFPVFIKPVHGSYGHGTFSLTNYDAPQQTFKTNSNEKIELSEVLSVGNNHSYCGLLIQSCLQPHPEVLQAVGPSTSCVRVILIRDESTVFIHRAFWKIARVHNITDNFSYGKHGNLLANVDIHSGKVSRVINGLGPSFEYQDKHPDTGHRLMDFQLPNWQEAIEQCKHASHIFPGLSLQSWDIAFCQQGPVLMELNTEPNLEVPQMLSEKAFLDDRLLKILQKRGWGKS